MSGITKSPSSILSSLFAWGALHGFWLRLAKREANAQLENSSGCDLRTRSRPEAHRALFGVRLPLWVSHYFAFDA